LGITALDIVGHFLVGGIADENETESLGAE
jgi:hypothetical protein